MWGFTQDKIEAVAVWGSQSSGFDLTSTPFSLTFRLQRPEISMALLGPLNKEKLAELLQSSRAGVSRIVLKGVCDALQP